MNDLFTRMLRQGLHCFGGRHVLVRGGKCGFEGFFEGFRAVGTKRAKTCETGDGTASG
jgi:hypothetical protein